MAPRIVAAPRRTRVRLTAPCRACWASCQAGNRTWKLGEGRREPGDNMGYQGAGIITPGSSEKGEPGDNMGYQGAIRLSII
eukprot:scaffold10701_cov56-Phaeocystis_antarctica.AAC.3